MVVQAARGQFETFISNVLDCQLRRLGDRWMILVVDVAAASRRSHIVVVKEQVEPEKWLRYVVLFGLC